MGSEKIGAWFRLARLQFYPMTWLAYSLGALVQAGPSGRFDMPSYWLGYALIFLIELASVMTNEYFDYDSDRRNENYSLFTGGTRVLVEGSLSFREVRTAILATVALIPIPVCLLLRGVQGGSLPADLLLATAGLVLGIGYTAPPLKFSYRGLGEFTVGATHSLYVILCGSVFQGGHWLDPSPWLIGVPLFFAVVGANILAGIPDWEADREVRKRSFAVLFGPRPALVLAMLCTALAFLAWRFLAHAFFASPPAFPWEVAMLIHGLLLTAALYRRLRAARPNGSLNGLMALALSYVIWFGLLPLLALW